MESLESALAGPQKKDCGEGKENFEHLTVCLGKRVNRGQLQQQVVLPDKIVSMRSPRTRGNSKEVNLECEDIACLTSRRSALKSKQVNHQKGVYVVLYHL